MRPSRNNLWLVLATLGGVAYPFLVYFGIHVIPSAAVVLLGVGLMVARLIGIRRLPEARDWLAAGVLAIGAMAGLVFWSPELAVKAYPPLVSLAVAAVFGLSLAYPPTAIERIVRLREPDLPPQAVAYIRRVTWLWVVFLLGNAAVSIAVGLWGSLETWTLWNGLVSYLLMGGLFLGELALRKFLRRRAS